MQNREGGIKRITIMFIKLSLTLKYGLTFSLLIPYNNHFLDLRELGAIRSCKEEGKNN